MSDSSQRPRILIVGMDGATFDVIDPLVADGRMPHLARLLGEGVSARLRSTQPCQSSVAWPAFMTGKNPGKNGVFAFWDSEPGRVLRPLISYRSIKTQTMWELLSDRGYRVGSVNTPVTFPPPPVNGTMVAGLLTPSRESPFTWPRDLHAELLANVGPVPIEMELMRFAGRGNANEIQFLEAAYEALGQRTRIARYLMERDPDWDVFMCTWTITDRVQHFFWKYMDEEHPEYETERGRKLRDVIRQCYCRVDRELGLLLESIDLGRDTVVIASDHGFGPKRKNVYLNQWLQDRGLLRFKEPFALRRWRPAPRPVSLGGVLRRLGWDHPMTERLRRYRVPFVRPVALPEFMMIDWSRTRAFTNFIGSEEGIFVNLRGREPEGSVSPGAEYEAVREEIIQGLQELTDPEDGLPVVDEIRRREEIYHGPYVDRAPDLIITMREHSYMPAPGLRTGVVFRSTADPLVAGGQQEGESGQHRDDGILVMAGAGAADTGERFEGAHITDVLPTMLHILGEAIPADIDGKVLAPGLNAELAARPPEIAESEEGADASRPSSGASSAHSAEEEALVKERLKALGYFG